MKARDFTGAASFEVARALNPRAFVPLARTGWVRRMLRRIASILFALVLLPMVGASICDREPITGETIPIPSERAVVYWLDPATGLGGHGEPVTRDVAEAVVEHAHRDFPRMLHDIVPAGPTVIAAEPATDAGLGMEPGESWAFLSGLGVSSFALVYCFYRCAFTLGEADALRQRRRQCPACETNDGRWTGRECGCCGFTRGNAGRFHE